MTGSGSTVKEGRMDGPSEIPESFRIEFLKRGFKVEVKNESLERLSLSKIVAAARKMQSHELLTRLADYYARNQWLWAAGNIYELIGTSESLQRAERCYVEGGNYRSATRVCKAMGDPDALKRALDYSCRTC